MGNNLDICNAYFCFRLYSYIAMEIKHAMSCKFINTINQNCLGKKNCMEVAGQLPLFTALTELTREADVCTATQDFV